MTFSEIIDEILKHENCVVDTSLMTIGETHLFCTRSKERIDQLIANGEKPSKNVRAQLDKEIALEILSNIKAGKTFPIKKQKNNN